MLPGAAPSAPSSRCATPATSELTPAELARRQRLVDRNLHESAATADQARDAARRRGALLAKLQQAHRTQYGEEFDAAARGFSAEEIAHARLVAGEAEPITATVERVSADAVAAVIDGPPPPTHATRKREPRWRSSIDAAKQACTVELESEPEPRFDPSGKAPLRALARDSIRRPDAAIAMHIDALQLDELDDELAKQDDAAAEAPAVDPDEAETGRSQAPAAAVVRKETRRKVQTGAERAMSIAARSGKKRRRHEYLREEHQKKAKGREERRQAAWAAECAAKHDNKRPPYIPVDQWRMSREVVIDRGGRSASWWIRQASRIFGPAPVALVVRAAMAISDDGEALYDWTDERARKILAAGLFLLYQARRDRRHRAPRRANMRDSRIVRGVSRKTLAALLQDPFTRKQPSKTTLTGYWRTGDVYRGEVGYVRALVETGAIYRQQLPPDSPKLDAWEIGSDSGYAMNRYFVPTQLTLETGEALAMGQWLAQLLDGQHVYELRRRARATQPDAPN